MNTPKDDGSESLNLLTNIVEIVLPQLTPYEFVIYVYLLQRSLASDVPGTARVGKRTIASDCGRGSRGSSGPYAHIGKLLKNLADKGYISIGETTRAGTLYVVKPPHKLLAAIHPDPSTSSEEDWYRDPLLRKELFERNAWICRYCGEVVSSDNSTLDHIIPAWQGGADSPDNLATCCLMCNSIKSGRSYTESATDILQSIRARKANKT